MQKNPSGTRLKLWNDWSAGCGHLIDDGRTPGMYSSSGLLGLRGELRPAPFFNSLAGSGGLGTATLSWALSGPGNAAVIAATIEPSGSGVDVTFDATANGKATAASLTFAHTCTGASLCLSVSVSVDGACPTGVTYNGVAMTKVGDQDATTGNVSLWQLVAPAAGAHDVVVTCGAADEIVGGSISYTNVDQTDPIGDYEVDAWPASTSPTVTVVGQTNGAAIGAIKAENVTITSGQTERWNDIEGVAVRGAGQTTTVAVGSITPQYFVEEPVAGDPTQPYLYAMSGWSDGSVGKHLHKISLANADFGTLMAGAHEIPTGLPGQPAKYQTDWWFPTGLNYSPSKLDAVGSGGASNDTFTAGTTPFLTGSGDHYANLNFQLVGVVNGAGVYILKEDGNPQTAADWGPAFQVGDKNTRPTAVRSLAGNSFVLKKDGLFSFNTKALSRLIFEDFNVTTSLDQMAMVPWYEGFAIGAPQGLFYYVPGERPVNIAFYGRLKAGAPPSGVTELLPGRFLGLATSGSFLFTIYQPDPTDTAALIMFAEAQGDPLDAELQWGVLGSITLDSASCFAGLKVADSGYPTSTAETVPSLWFSNVGDPRYLALAPTGSPVRARADKHKVCTSADAYMSEVRFTEPMDLSGIVVRTSADMTDGDELQISLIADGTGRDENVGPPIRGGGTRHILPLGRHSVTSMVLRVNWAATSAADRVPPAIHSIELFGQPAVRRME